MNDRIASPVYGKSCIQIISNQRQCINDSLLEGIS